MTNAVIPLARPRLPAAARIMPYLHEIDANRRYSDDGPLAHRLRARLAQHWGLAKAELALVANGTLAISLTLLASGAAPGSRCLMPAWAPSASAAAVRAAGLLPHFVDVEPGSWTLDPDCVLALARQPGVGAILVTVPFGAPTDLAVWDDVRGLTGVPVVIDAASAFDTLRVGGPMTLGNCPLIVSLHAAEAFGMGEGGAVLCRDAEWLDRIARLGCLDARPGQDAGRDAGRPGLNGRIAEYAAAAGLAGLDTWHETRARWAAVTRHFERGLRTARVRLVPGFGQGWVAAALHVVWPADRLPGIATLPMLGIDIARPLGGGCHAHEAFAACPREALPITETLARVAVALPFWQDLTAAEIERVCDAVTACSAARVASLDALAA